MEKPDIAGASDLQPAGPVARAERSRRRSAESSGSDPEKGDTATADEKPNDFAVELSLLQSVYEQAIKAGLKARAIPTQTIDGQMPVLVIQMLNVGKCPECGSWILGWKCPTC